MLKIDRVDIYGWDAAIRGARNPMNSWDKIDSYMETHDRCIIGLNDYKLLKGLCIAGKDHRKFMRMINVTMDIIAPLYWWKEFDTYKVGTVANSCSTMHKIQVKEFTLDDFSCEHLLDDRSGAISNKEHFEFTIHHLNKDRKLYLETNDKKYWWQMIQLLPSSYNQKRTVQFNYEVLATMYQARKHHKLDEWHTFCKTINKLHYSEFITGRIE